MDEFNKYLALLGIDVAEEQAKAEVMTKIVPVIDGTQAERYIDDIKQALQEKHEVIVIDSFVEKESGNDG
jgi:hypothetical protein